MVATDADVVDFYMGLLPATKFSLSTFLQLCDAD